MKCLNTTMTRPNCVNVIVTQTQLVASLTKVLLFGLAPIFDVENIYSAAKCGKTFYNQCSLLPISMYPKSKSHCLLATTQNIKTCNIPLKRPIKWLSRMTEKF